MLFWIKINGRNVGIQAVLRNGKPYWRLAPYTLVYPTKRQLEVRLTLSNASHRSINKTYKEINNNVKDAFKTWKKYSSHINNTEELIKELYGNEADEVLSYISNQKYVSDIILKNPETREYINNKAKKVIEKL